jgi:hypothetical protein
MILIAKGMPRLMRGFFKLKRAGVVASGMLFLLVITGCKKSVMNIDSYDIFVPEENGNVVCKMSAGCPDAPSKSPAIQLSSSEIARYALRSKKLIDVKTGERYRLSAWVKANEGVTVGPRSPGILLRGTLYAKNRTDYPNGHIYVGTKGAARQDANKLYGVPAPLQWTKIEAVIEIPPGVVELKLFVFCWYTSGSICVDQASVEKVGNDVQLSPLL